jgi:hypothetical protein
MATTGINSLLAMISDGKGMATSNNFAVTIDFSGASVSSVVGSKWSYDGTASADETRMMIFCDEVALPGYQLATGSVTRYSGDAPVYYPTAPIYNDIQLSFMCDAKMTPMHKLHQWMEYIFEDNGTNGNETGRRVRYPKDYQAKIIIKKTERSRDSDNGAISSVFTLYNAWPYTIDAVPLSYGSSQLVKVNANFYYKKFKRETDTLKNRG